MISLLAQVTADPDPAALKEWLGVALYLVGIATAVLGAIYLVKQLREKPAETPQPLIVQGHVQFVPREEFDKEIKQAHGRMNRERDDAKAAILLVAQQAAALSLKLDNEIRAVGEQLVGNNNAGERRMQDLRGEIGVLATELRDDAKEERDALHTRITDLLGAFRELKGKVEIVISKS